MFMKHLSCYLTLMFLVLAGGILQSCKDNDEPTPPEPTPELTLTVGATGTNSVELKLTNTNMKEYAYQVTTNLSTAAPSAAILFGTGTTGTLTEGENSITITGLEGNTEYMVHLATKSDAGFGEKVLSQKIKTSAYTELVTITERHFTGISFHIEVPEGKHISYAVLERENYLAFKQQFGYTDADLLNKTQPISASATITFTEMTDEETGDTFARFRPGEALVVIVGEMEMGPDPWNPEQQTWIPCFDFEKYINNGSGPGPLAEGDPVTEEECWTGVHAAVYANCKAPERVDADIKIEQVTRTTRTVEYTVTPDETVIAYCYNYVDMATWESLMEQLGEDGLICWISSNSYTTKDPARVACTDLQPGVTYKFVVIGKVNEDGTKHCVYIEEFSAGEATKPAPEIVVTGIKAPEGQTESPYLVWFNIKALNKDVVSAKYLANDVSEWVKQLNTGTTYVAMMNQYGNPLDADAIAAMNTDAGYNLSFPSWEDSETRLVVCGYNDEEVANSPDKDTRGWADNRTIEEPAAPAVSSSLFNELTGDWTATATLLVSTYDAETGKYIESESPTPKIAKVTISQKLEFATTCPDEVYPMYPDKDKEYVDELYNDFLTSAEKYNRKVKQQNRLICEGLDITNYYTKYMSPYALFINESYNAYDTDELFFAFGPKWYLEIGEGDQVQVPTDLNRIPPVCAWYRQTIYFSGVSSDGYDPSLKGFKVTVSEDKQTLTVEPVVVDGQTYYPSLISITNGFASAEAKCAKLVLTKGWTDASARASMKKAPAFTPQEVQGTTYFNPAKPHHRTRIGSVKAIDYKHVTVKPLSYQKVREAKLQSLQVERPRR